jgi:hypothetical protein
MRYRMIEHFGTGRWGTRSRDVQDALSKLEQSRSRVELVDLCCKGLGFGTDEH